MPSHKPDHSSHEHEHKPFHVDQSYHLVVRSVLWVIAGSVLVAFCLWWFLT